MQLNLNKYEWMSFKKQSLKYIKGACVYVCSCVHMHACVYMGFKNSFIFRGASDTYCMNTEGFPPRCSDNLPKCAKTKSLRDYELT